MKVKSYDVKELMFWKCPKDKRINQKTEFRPYVKDGDVVNLIDTDMSVNEDFIEDGVSLSYEALLLSRYAPFYLLDMFRNKPYLFDFEINFIVDKLTSYPAEREL